MEHEIAHSDSPELGVGQAEVSKRLGKIWKGLSDEEKRPYFEQAEVEKEMHAAKYPNYVFAPRRPKAKVLAGALPRLPALEPRKFTLAPPVRSSAPTPETYAQRDPTPVVAWAPPAQQPTMPAMRTERAFDLSQEIYAPRPMRAPQGISVFEALQATPPQQVPEPVFHYMQQLDQSQPLNEKKSSIEDWRLNVTEVRSSLTCLSTSNTSLITFFSSQDRPSPRDELPFDELFDDYPEQQAFNDAPVVQSHHSNRAPEQRGFVASTPYYRSNEVPAYHSSQVAQDVVYHSASSASSPASGATTLSSALYPTPTPSPPRRPNFQLNDWNAPEYRYY